MRRMLSSEGEEEHHGDEHYHGQQRQQQDYFTNVNFALDERDFDWRTEEENEDEHDEDDLEGESSFAINCTRNRSLLFPLSAALSLLAQVLLLLLCALFLRFWIV